MNKATLFFSLFLITLVAQGQQSFIGIQNSPRKGMIQTSVNPAEINHLSKKVEVNLFAVGATVGNNALTFRNLVGEEDILERVFEKMDGPVNLNAEGHVLGPSVGFSVDKWSFGFISQAFVKGDIVQLDASLGNAFNDDPFASAYHEVLIRSSSNQRVNVAGWAELGLVAGREIWSNEKHTFSGGATFKFLIPGSYVNMGVGNLQGKLVQDGFEFNLTDASGQLDINYPDMLEDWDLENQLLDQMSLGNITGFAVDLGISHQWKGLGFVKTHSGLSVRNIGGFNLGATQVNHSYHMLIPEGQSFRLDVLEGSLEEMEEQLLNSGYFTRTVPKDRLRLGVPTLLSAYTEVQLSKVFQVDLFGQFRVYDREANNQVNTQNVVAITPRFNLGLLEIYSPWATYDISGLAGGLGLRVGGFFVGSRSVLTGLMADTRQIDAHVGFSMGFGKH